MSTLSLELDTDEHRLSSLVRLEMAPSGKEWAGFEVADQVAGEVEALLCPSRNGAKSRSEAQDSPCLKGQANFRKPCLRPTSEARLVEMTILEKPQSSNQKLRLSPNGRSRLTRRGAR
ncbi:Fic family protein [Planctomycetota bacterium]